MRLAPRLGCGLLLLIVTSGTCALASVVTITVRTAAGVAAEDALIVFEPLDAVAPAGKALRAARNNFANGHRRHFSQQR
jgi:hypothetical protein